MGSWRDRERLGRMHTWLFRYKSFDIVLARKKIVANLFAYYKRGIGEGYPVHIYKTQRMYHASNNPYLVLFDALQLLLGGLRRRYGNDRVVVDAGLLELLFDRVGPGRRRRWWLWLRLSRRVSLRGHRRTVLKDTQQGMPVYTRKRVSIALTN